MDELSKRQQRILDYIRDFLIRRGYPPTVRDIQAGCRVSSTSVVDYNLRALENAGYLRRHKEVSRGIEVVGMRSGGGGAMMVPLVGVIAAGTPIPVPSADTWDITGGADILRLSSELTRGRDNVFALRVKGDSMIEELIKDGDIILMQQASTVENGQTAAVWLKREKEVTLKKVYVEKGCVRLQPANNQMQPIFTSPDNVEIQGRVISVIRQIG